MIRRICSYCKSELGIVEDALSDVRVSHGVCLECLRAKYSQFLSSFDEFFESISHPVMVVDEGSRLIYANEPARAFAGKELEEIRDIAGGEFIDCIYASSPEGCGQTIHCQSCVIRKEVAKTAITGHAAKRVPALVDVSRYTGDERVRFLISTEKVEDIVVVQIEEIDLQPPKAADG